MFKARYLLSAALAPAVLLFFYIRKKDKIEPEPMKMLLQLVGLGVLSIVPAVVLELLLPIPFAYLFGTDSIIYRINLTMKGLAFSFVEDEEENKETEE